MAVVRHCPLPRRALYVWALSPACSTQTCVMQGLSGPPALPSLSLPRSLTHSLSSSHTSPHCAPPNSSGIHSEKKQASWQRAQTTLLKKERERKNERETAWGRRSGREGGIYRKTEEGGESTREIERGRRVVKREMEIKPESDEEIECCFYNYRHFCVPGCLIVFKTKSFLLSEDHIKSVKKTFM